MDPDAREKQHLLVVNLVKLHLTTWSSVLSTTQFVRLGRLAYIDADFFFLVLNLGKEYAI